MKRRERKENERKGEKGKCDKKREMKMDSKYNSAN